MFFSLRICDRRVSFIKRNSGTHTPCGFYFGTNVEWNILKYPVDEANTLFADPYAILVVRTGYKTKHGFEVFFEVKNLANKIYAASVAPSTVESPGHGKHLIRLGEPCDHVIPKSIVVVSRWGMGPGNR
jgi:hypothetical protein